MKRTKGVLLCFAGFTVAILSWLVQYPAFVIVNGRYIPGWMMVGTLGMILTLLGVTLLIPKRRF